VSLNKSKVLASAQKYVQRGAFDKAIREYLRLIEDDPKDVRTLLRIGDLHARRGDAAAAAQTYDRVAQAYTEQGFFQKAVAVYKQILKVDPGQMHINEKLAELYQQLGLVSNAMEQFQILAGAYERQGRTRETITTYQRIVQLDPDNVASRVKLAELFSREGKTEEGVSEFELACEQLLKQKRQDDYVKVAERLLFLDPGKIDETRRLARVYLDRGDARRALAKLQVCFKADPRHMETLSFLAETFRALGQVAKAISVWKELAKIYREREMPDEEKRVWSRVRDAAPEDADAQVAFDQISERRDERPAAATPSEKSEARAISAAPVPLPERRPVAPAPPAPTPAGPAAAQRPDPAAGPEVDKAIADADIYVDYGLLQKAREHLEHLLERFPKHGPALARLAKIAERVGENTEACRANVALARISTSASEQRDLLERAFRLSPGDAEVIRALEELGLPVPAGFGPSAPSERPVRAPAPRPEAPRREPVHAQSALPIADLVGEEIIIVEDGEQDTSDETVFGPPPGAFVAPVSRAAAAGAGRVATPLAPDEVAAEASRRRPGTAPLAPEGKARGGEPAEQIPFQEEGTAVAARPSSLDLGDDELLARALDGLGGSDAEAPWESQLDPSTASLLGGPKAKIPTLDEIRLDTGSFEVPDVDERTIVGALAPAAERGVASAADASEFERRLEEADFFVTQGLLEEAELILTELVREHPHRADVATRLSAIRERVGPRTDELPPAPDGSEEVVIEDRFDDLTQIAEAPPRAEDVETHYDLGIAYKEMGLLDDAIQEFREAMRSPTRELSAMERIAACLIEKGALEEAVQQLKRGLSSPNMTDLAALDFYYCLGVAHEGLGDHREALYYFRRVHAAMKDFRDVAQRLAQLARDGDGAARGEGGAASSRTAPARRPG
jgi:tetratricopeptide (TPR) repeat protein